MKKNIPNKIIIISLLILGLILYCFIAQTYNVPNIQEQKKEEKVIIYHRYDYTKNIKSKILPEDMNQNWEEFIVAANLLEAYNINISKWNQFIAYFSFGDNWDVEMSPYGLCWEKGISNGLDKYLVANKLSFTPQTKALTFKEIQDKVNNGIPVIVWITNDFQAPRWNHNITLSSVNPVYSFYENNNAVLIKSIDKSKVTFSDPHNGIQEIDINEFKVLYEEVGQHALWLESINN